MMHFDYQLNKISSPVVVSFQQAQSFGRFAEILRNEAITVVNFPMINTRTVEVDESIINIFSNLNIFDFIIFTSSACVNSFVEIARILDVDISAVKAVSIGKQTSELLKINNIDVAFENPGKVFDDLALSMLDNNLFKDKSVLRVCGNLANCNFEREFSKSFSFRQAVIYNTVAADSLSPLASKIFKTGKVDVLAFASGSEIETFVNIFHLDVDIKKVPVFVIGSITQKSATQLGFEKIFVASKPDFGCMANDILNFLKTNN